MPSVNHRWVIDSIAEQVAAIEVDGAQVVHLPQWVLPQGAAEGQLLAVRHELDRQGKRSTITIELDVAATTAALAESTAQVDGIKSISRDKGGNIKL
jgi:hypothetical protein